jgi:hypothetical protein
MTRKSEGRFDDHVRLLVTKVAESHVFSERRAKKLVGRALSDPRIIASILEQVNMYVTGRGDGLTLVDLAENKLLKQSISKTPKQKGTKNAVSGRSRKSTS